jgi:hypothetical protein
LHRRDVRAVRAVRGKGARPRPGPSRQRLQLQSTHAACPCSR